MNNKPESAEIQIDYDEIGRRIRHYRKACHLSQEQLAEAVGISVTHLSHIETGNTKLSLPVFVAIASVLTIQTDELLRDSRIENRSRLQERILETLDGCSASELLIISDIINSTAVALHKYV